MMNKKIAKIMKKYKLDFSGKNLTGFGGMLLVREMMRLLDVTKIVADAVHVKKRERGFADVEFVQSLLYNIIEGGACLDDLAMLREDTTTRRLLNLEGVPHPSTAGLYLKRFTLGHLNQLERAVEQIQQRARRFERFHELTIDIDSSIYEQASKNKSGSARAYNGLVGYHPLLAFIDQTGELVQAQLRSGNTYSSKDAVKFLKKCLKKLRKNVYKRLRADSAFYDESILRYLEEQQVEYTIVAEQKGRLLDEVINIAERDWRPMPGRDNAEVAEFEYKTTRGDGYRRYIVKRELKEVSQGWFSFERYRYHVIVTNSADEDIAALMEFQLDHANVENHIKEHKSGFDLEKLPTGNFNANKAYFLIGQLAYNLIAWLKSFFLPEHFARATIKTIRHKFLFVAAKVIRRSNQVFIKLSKNYLRKQQFLETLYALE